MLIRAHEGTRAPSLTLVSSSPALPLAGVPSRVVDTVAAKRPKPIMLASASSSALSLAAPAVSTGEVPQAPAGVPIRSTVGKGAMNRPADVRAVQERLRELGAEVVVSGRFDDATSRALKAVLADFMRNQGATQTTDRLVPTSPITSYFFGVANERLSQARARVPLTAAVGSGQANHAADVRAVQERLREIGFDVAADGEFGSQTSRFIRLFASMVFGVEQLAHAPDVVAGCCACGGCDGGIVTDALQPGSVTAERLFAPDAPRWTTIPDSGVGFVLTDKEGYSYVTERALRVLERAGERYAQYLATDVNAVPFAINDASLHDGSVRTTSSGRPEHQSHRNGLDIDIRLPRKAVYGEQRYGVRVGDPAYDSEATYEIIRAFGRDDQVERILTGDRALITRAQAAEEPWAYKLQYDAAHKDHLHVDVLPPTDEDAPAAPSASGATLVG